MRRGPAAALVMAALAASGMATALLLRDGPAPPPASLPPAEPPLPAEASTAVRASRPVTAPGPAAAPLPAPALLPSRFPSFPPPPGEEDDGWKAYPEGGKGPIIVGIVRKYGDPDPECWVALESAADPSRPDPSVVETLEDGRFRLTGMAPGRYRVRVKEDETLPTYSAVLEARDGEVADAGVLRLNRRGFISGVLRDATGGEVPGEVRLFGRDPASLETKVVEIAPCIGRQGFQVAAHEAGEFTLAATADAGFLVHRGKTDGNGLAWADLRLRPWATLDAGLAPAKPGSPAVRAVEIRLRTLEAPDLGIPAPGGTMGAPARFDRLPPGRYRVSASWEEQAGKEEEQAGRAWTARDGSLDLAIAEGEAARAEIPR